jgi:hypothetical protein
MTRQRIRRDYLYYFDQYQRICRTSKEMKGAAVFDRRAFFVYEMRAWAEPYRSKCSFSEVEKVYFEFKPVLTFQGMRFNRNRFPFEEATG